jgi:hypothetical protein
LVALALMSMPAMEPPAVVAVPALEASWRALRASSHIISAKKPRTATSRPSNNETTPSSASL